MVKPNQRHVVGLKTRIHRSSLQRNRRGHTTSRVLHLSGIISRIVKARPFLSRAKSLCG